MLHLDAAPATATTQLGTLAHALPADFFMTTALAAAAIFCLPRQFLAGIVECADPQDPRFSGDGCGFESSVAASNLRLSDLIGVRYARQRTPGAHGSGCGMVERIGLRNRKPGVRVVCGAIEHAACPRQRLNARSTDRVTGDLSISVVCPRGQRRRIVAYQRSARIKLTPDRPGGVIAGEQLRLLPDESIPPIDAVRVGTNNLRGRILLFTKKLKFDSAVAAAAAG